MRRVTVAAAAIITGLALTSCSGDDSQSSLEAENKAQDDSYNSLVAAEPAKTMTNPTTRETINFWIETWDRPGALSYNYLSTVTDDGEYKTVGYYILKGLPVSMCTSLTPNYEILDVQGDSYGPNLVVDAPGMDGVYYGSGDCERYYGQDATTGQYVEYTVPMNMMVRTTDQPLDNVQGAEPLGPSSVEDVE